MFKWENKINKSLSQENIDLLLFIITINIFKILNDDVERWFKKIKDKWR